jgi:hypothetical protein
MQSYYKVYQIYKGNCNMVQLPVMWTGIILRKLQVHLRYISMVLKVATPGGAPQRRPNMEPRDIQWKIPLVRTLTTPRNLLVVKLVPILRQEERRGNIPRVVTLKNSRNPNHPPSMERLRRGKKHNFGYSA